MLYVNGLEAARIVGYLREGHPRVVVHVHDLAELDSPRLTEADRRLVRDRTDREAAVAELDETQRLARALLVQADHIAAADDYRRRAIVDARRIARRDGAAFLESRGQRA